MPAWKFYEIEQKRHGQRTTFNIPILSRERVAVFVEAICKKYNLQIPKLTYRNVKFHRCLWKENRISFIPNHITVGVLCHEMGHYIMKHKFNDHSHNELLLNLIGILLDFLDDYVMDEKDRLGVKHPSQFR